MIGFAFSVLTWYAFLFDFQCLALTSASIKSWTALGGSLVVGITSGGPPVIIYGWIAVSVFSMAVAYSFAEICSAYPVAGGQYSWVALLAPPKWARLSSYVCGWFLIIGKSEMEPSS